MKKVRWAALAAALVAAAAWPAAAQAAWLTPDAQAALERHETKVPAQFEEWTQHALADGTLRVLATVTDRADPDVRAFVAANTVKVHWAEAVDGFLALIEPGQLPALLDNPAVRYVEPDHPLEYKLAGSTRNIRARDQVWSFTPGTGTLGSLTPVAPSLTTDQATGRGVTIAINDGGVDATHRDFGGFNCVAAPYRPCQSRIKRHVNLEHLVDFGLDVNAGSDFASGHGTHVAGIAAGNGYYAREGDADPPVYGADGVPIGVAPQADLVSIKNGEALSAAFASLALDWAAANHAEYGIKVINNSWGCLGGCAYSANSFTAQANKKLYEVGVLSVFAAGNDGGTGTGAQFAGDSQSPYVIAVANYDHRNNRLASTSSRGQESSTRTLPDPAKWTPESELAAPARRPDVGAPGTSVWAARNLTGGAAAGVPRVNTGDTFSGISGGVRPYVPMSGTSMAAPHVAGAGAVLFSACPSARVLDVMRALIAGADRTRVLSTDGTRVAQPFETGYGGLDVRAAIDWLRANGPAACRLEQPNIVPTASIAAPDEATATDAVTFDGGASTDADGTIVSYAWDFGDGATAAGAQASHAYARSGTYDVTLTVTDNRGATATALRTISIRNAVPTAAFDAPSTLRHEEAGTFDAGTSADRDGSIASYAWEFGDGGTATGAAPTHAYTWAGTYTVRLTVTDDEGATATTTRTVEVTDVPASGFKRLSATGLTSHRCDSSAWTFTLKPVAAGESPASVAVTWADGSRERVPLTSTKSKSSTYRTTRSLGEIATRAWADLPSASTAKFELTSGPCQ